MGRQPGSSWPRGRLARSMDPTLTWAFGMKGCVCDSSFACLLTTADLCYPLLVFVEVEFIGVEQDAFIYLLAIHKYPSIVVECTLAWIHCYNSRDRLLRGLMERLATGYRCKDCWR